MSRYVRVIVPRTSTTLELEGPLAELVALVATTPLSERTVRMLTRLVACEPALALLVYGRVEVDLTPTKAIVYERRHLERTVLLTGRGDPDAA